MKRGPHFVQSPGLMMKGRRYGMLLRRSLCIMLCLVIFIACGSGSDTYGQSDLIVSSNTGSAGSVPAASVPAVSPSAGAVPAAAPQPQPAAPQTPAGYQAPAFAESVYHADKAYSRNGGSIDISEVSKGYVGVSAVSDKRLKFQVVYGTVKYNYNLANDGTPMIFPLQSGNGNYKFRIMENIADSKYAEKCSVSADVVLADEFQPFIRPSVYINYSQASNCVLKAAELSKDAKDALEVISQVYSYITANVKYDEVKAKTVQSGYVPDPDETLRTGKGICFDYAALAGAMLRSRGIPTKVIFGYVSPGDLYHAWNMIYTREKGWIVVKIEIKGEQWVRLDMTVAAGGVSPSFVGDGNHYADVYSY
jgi:hypothetical protein